MLADPGDQATYTFTGSPGQVLYFDPRDATPGLRAALVDPLGVAVFTGALSSGDPGPFTLTRAGTYTLTISANSGATGAYDFVLDDAAAATPVAPGPGAGTVESGTLASGLATALYAFAGAAGERVYFQGQQDAPASGAVASLYNPDGTSNASFLLENAAQATLAEAGTYLLAVRGANAAGGAVSYRFEAFEDVAQTAALALGQEVTGTLADPGDQATYTFTGSPGQDVFFDGLSGAPGLVAALSDPGGNQLFRVAAGTDSGSYTLSQSGMYSLTISGGGSTGSYSVRLLDTSAQSLAPTTTLATVATTITPGTGATVYRIAGTAGEQLVLHSDTFASNVGRLVRR